MWVGHEPRPLPAPLRSSRALRVHVFPSCPPSRPSCLPRRPANRDSSVQGLYFVGASTRPGNGVPLCFISAKLTANRVLKDLGLCS